MPTEAETVRLTKGRADHDLYMMGVTTGQGPYRYLGSTRNQRAASPAPMAGSRGGRAATTPLLLPIIVVAAIMALAWWAPRTAWLLGALLALALLIAIDRRIGLTRLLLLAATIKAVVVLAIRYL